MTPLETLIQKVKSLDYLSFFKDNSEEKEVEKACVNYLKSLHYKVIQKPSLSIVRDLDGLVTLFYALLEYNHDSICSLVSNRDKDKALLSAFVKSRQEALEIDYNMALQDAAVIMHGLFNHEKSLGLTVPIGVWVFGSAKYKWVIDKVIFLLNVTEDLANAFTVTRLATMDEMQSKEYTGFDFDHLRRIHG